MELNEKYLCLHWKMGKEHIEKFFRTVYLPKHEVLFKIKKNFETIYTKKNNTANRNERQELWCL